MPPLFQFYQLHNLPEYVRHGGKCQPKMSDE
jgi:hypothetical protein